jgi:outer membrane lipoprotein LolB
VLRFRFWLTVATVSLLTACASKPPVVPPDATPGEQFELRGRVAVKLDGRGHSARMRWLHDSNSDAIWLYSPIGSTIATLTANADSATLVTARKETFRSGNVQQLTREILGWDLPLPGLQHWVLGRVDPAVPVTEIERDKQERITRLVQGGWHIDFAGYEVDGTLPRSLLLHFADLRLRLVIDRWNLALLTP